MNGLERGDKAIEIRDDSIDLRLLKHNFREPHAVGGDRALPGEVLASVLIEPCE